MAQELERHTNESFVITSDGLHPNSDGLQPSSFLLLVAIKDILP